MTDRDLIEAAYADLDLLPEAVEPIHRTIAALDAGELRVAEKKGDEWVVNVWVKEAIMLYFRITEVRTMGAGPFEYHDKIPLKTGYKEKGIRVVPHAVARYGSYISGGTILMPSYVNIGAYVDEGTMVDT